MEYKVKLFSQIHEIVFHGKGGYDYETVYNMPVWLRTFTFKKLNEYYEKEAEAARKASGKSKLGSKVPKGPAIKGADYTAKAPN